MEIAIILVIAIIAVAFLLYLWLLHPLKGLKLNDETYMFQKQEHLPKPKRKKRVRKNPQEKQ